jgi:hypothetical protein
MICHKTARRMFMTAAAQWKGKKTYSTKGLWPTGPFVVNVNELEIEVWNKVPGLSLDGGR